MVYPRTPEEVKPLIADLTKGKDFVDLGCAEGEMLKRIDCKSRTGYETDTNCLNIATKQKGMTIINKDFLNEKLKGDVFYCYNHANVIDKLFKKIEKENIKGTFIIGQTNSYTTDGYLEKISTEKPRVCCEGCFKVFIIKR